MSLKLSLPPAYCISQPLLPAQVNLSRKNEPGCWAGLVFSEVTPWCQHPGVDGISWAVLLDFPRRVVRDVHRKIIARASQRRHSYARKWFASGDALILSGTAGDDMRSTTNLRLGLVEVSSIEGRENLVAVAV